MKIKLQTKIKTAIRVGNRNFLIVGKTGSGKTRFVRDELMKFIYDNFGLDTTLIEGAGKLLLNNTLGAVYTILNENPDYHTINVFTIQSTRDLSPPYFKWVIIEEDELSV